MSLMRLPVRQNTDEWLALRRTGVSASMMPVITGNRPGLMGLWAEHCGLAEPEAPDAALQELFDIGHALEEPIAQLYAARTGRPVKRVDHMVRHPEIAWAYASLDRVSAVKGERRVIELKYAPHRWGDEVDEVPPAVQDQVQWQLLVTGWVDADVAVLRGGRLDIHAIVADPAYQDSLLTLARWFQGLVERRERPPIDGSEDTRRTLAAMHPRDTEPELDPTPELSAMALRIRETTAALKAAKAADDEARNVMRGLLGDSAGVRDEALGYRVTWRRSKDGVVTTTDWQAVARAYREVIERMYPSAGAELVATSEPAALDAIEALHTATEEREGSRVLRPYFRDETGRWV